MVLHTSKAGIDLIKEFEGLRLESYQDSAGIWTIGWGTTRMPDGKPIHEGLLITKERAEKLLEREVGECERHVQRLVQVELTQHQLDALVVFAYNIGWPKFAGSTLLKKLNAGDYDGAAAEFMRWNKAQDKKDGGKLKPFNGLTRRRKAERDLFLGAANVS